jgi:hypothetical protein
MKALVLAAMLAAIPTVQTNDAAGVWTAELNGKTSVKVELHADGATLAGTISVSDLNVDMRSGLQSVADRPADGHPIFNVMQSGATVTFSASANAETFNVEFRVRDDGRAELRFLLTDAQRAIMGPVGSDWFSQPFVLTRQPH